MSTIDWRKIRDTLPPIAEDEPALSIVRTQIQWLDKYPNLVGNDPVTGIPYAELQRQFRRNLEDEIERYRWQKAGWEPTQEMLEACRDE